MGITIFLIIVAAFGIVWSIINSDLKSTIITIGIGLSTALALCPKPTIKTIGLIMYVTLAILAIISSVVKKKINKSDRLIIILIILPIVVYWIFAFNHYPGAALIKIFLIIPIISFIACLKNRKRFKNEFGYLIMFVADSLSIVIPILINLITDLNK